MLQNDLLLLEEYLRALHKYDNFELKDLPNKGGHKQASDEVSELETKRDEIMINLESADINSYYFN